MLRRKAGSSRTHTWWRKASSSIIDPSASPQRSPSSDTRLERGLAHAPRKTTSRLTPRTPEPIQDPAAPACESAVNRPRGAAASAPVVDARIMFAFDRRGYPVGRANALPNQQTPSTTEEPRPEMNRVVAAPGMRMVADDVYVVEHAYTNCYVIVDDDAVTLVDACYPATWNTVRDGLASIGRSVSDVAALLLTHGHFDHVGFARSVQQRLGIPVWIHEDDRWLAAHPYRYRPQRNRVLYPLLHPRSLPRAGSHGRGRRPPRPRSTPRPPSVLDSSSCPDRRSSCPPPATPTATVPSSCQTGLSYSAATHWSPWTPTPDAKGQEWSHPQPPPTST